jgi:hypothetical protein
MTADIARILAVADQLREQPERRRVSEVLARRSRGIGWLAGIPAAQEAVIDVMRQMLRDSPGDARRPGSGSPIQLASSAIEPPSALLALHSVFPRAELHPQAVGEPDPRLRLYPGEGTVVWRYEGTRARPAIAPPSADAAERVRALAVPEWPHIPAAFDRALELAQLPIGDLLGVLVHPPAPPAGEAGEKLRRRPDVWIRAVQAFACLGIAQHGIDRPWQGSERRRVLAELFYGPEDWVTEAAGFALVALAWKDPDLRREVGGLVSRRWMTALEAGRTREVSILGSLTQLVLACPWLEEGVIDVAGAVLTGIQEAAEQPPPDLAARGAELSVIARSKAPEPPAPPESSTRPPRRFGFPRR